MLDIKFLRQNPDIVKENIKKKFQDAKLPLVDEVIAKDEALRAAISEAGELRAKRNSVSKQIGALMSQGKKAEAEAAKQEVAQLKQRLETLEADEQKLKEEVRAIMLVIPNIIDGSVPVGRDDSENVEVEKFGEPVVPDFEVPYHTDIMEKISGHSDMPGIDIDSARKTSGAGFYYLVGDVARLHSDTLVRARFYD